VGYVWGPRGVRVGHWLCTCVVIGSVTGGVLVVYVLGTCGVRVGHSWCNGVLRVWCWLGTGGALV
jgi:hypothetical protein